MTTELSQGDQSRALPVPDELMDAANLYAELADLDLSTVLQSWLRIGAERELLQLVSDGELSTGKFVEIMGITHFDVSPLAEKYGMELGPTAEQSQYSWERHGDAVARILRNSRKPQQEQQ